MYATSRVLSSTTSAGANGFDKIFTNVRTRYSSSSRLFGSTNNNYSYRKERKEVAKNLGKTSKELDWEHYEFSQK
jgi:hypothetical protein